MEVATVAKRNRDDFLDSTRMHLAMRAGFRCSMLGCGVLTIGPSDESADAFASIGVASHIHAAAPGGRRYDPDMSVGERKDIRNGIWLCASHSVEIDRDEARYTSDVLRTMKADHERHIAEELNSGRGFLRGSDLVAIGPDIVVFGELLGTSGREWSVRIDHFVQGDIRTLIDFSEGFQKRDPFDSYLIVNALGDGRQLASEPAWRRVGKSLELTFTVNDNFPRADAHDLEATAATGPTNDFLVEGGDIATVSGVNSLPQRIKQILSLLQGESPSNPKAGSRIKEYLDDFGDSPWLERWFKLDVIRLTCVPYHDRILDKVYTLVPSVRYVEEVQVLAGERDGDWQKVRFRLGVEGVGPWEGIVPIFMPLGPVPRRPAEWDHMSFD